MKSNQRATGETPQPIPASRAAEPSTGELQAFRSFVAEVMGEAQSDLDTRRARLAHHTLRRYRHGETLSREEIRLLARALAQQFLRRRVAGQ